jgi:hypothetical protein
MNIRPQATGTLHERRHIMPNCVSNTAKQNEDSEKKVNRVSNKVHVEYFQSLPYRLHTLKTPTMYTAIL